MMRRARLHDRAAALSPDAAPAAWFRVPGERRRPKEKQAPVCGLSKPHFAVLYLLHGRRGSEPGVACGRVIRRKNFAYSMKSEIFDLAARAGNSAVLRFRVVVAVEAFHVPPAMVVSNLPSSA
jgi:hypothetical protein